MKEVVVEEDVTMLTSGMMIAESREAMQPRATYLSKWRNTRPNGTDPEKATTACVELFEGTPVLASNISMEYWVGASASAPGSGTSVRWIEPPWVLSLVSSHVPPSNWLNMVTTPASVGVTVTRAIS